MKRSISEYKSAIPYLRKFSPKFKGSNGFDLRLIDKKGYLTGKKKKLIDEWLDFLRPLTAYGFKTRKLKNRKDTINFYADYYGLDKIPATFNRAIYQVDSDGRALKKKNGRFFLTNGTQIERYHFSDKDRRDIASGDLSRLDYLWNFYDPDSVSMIAGINPVRVGGSISMSYNVGQLKRAVNFLGSKYTGNHAIENWFSGLDFYFSESSKLKEYRQKEASNYEERQILVKELNLARRSLNEAKRELDSFDKSTDYIIKTIKPRERDSYRKMTLDARAKLLKKLEKVEKRFIAANTALYEKR